MKKIRILFLVLKTTGIVKYILALLAAFFTCAGLLLVAEPSFKTYGESLWYCFTCCTTIGFGDMVAETIAGRIITVILYFIAFLVVSITIGVIVSYNTELIKAKHDESLVAFMDKLENLPDLSKEELKALSENVSSFRRRGKK